jgi:hypothetical protein
MQQVPPVRNGVRIFPTTRTKQTVTPDLPDLVLRQKMLHSTTKKLIVTLYPSKNYFA